MWLITQHGFYSIVRKGPDDFHVRARVRADLAELRELTALQAEIEEWPQADYRYRLRVNRDDYRLITRTLAETVDYPNFKERVGERESQRPKRHAYFRIWETLARLQR